MDYCIRGSDWNDYPHLMKVNISIPFHETQLLYSVSFRIIKL